MKKSPTKYVVGGVIGLGLCAMIFAVMDWRWGVVALVLLVYEGWTLVNKFPNDTISEILQQLAERPMIPWIFGVATGWAIESGYVHNPWLIAGLLFLQGHFFFQNKRK